MLVELATIGTANFWIGGNKFCIGNNSVDCFQKSWIQSSANRAEDGCSQTDRFGTLRAVEGPPRDGGTEAQSE